MRRRVPSLPLFWRVFAANARSWCSPSPGLVFAPVTVSVPVGASELLVLAVGLVALLIANLVLLRPAFAPLDELAETMRRHDPLAPGARAEVSGDPDVVALAQTFNDMLDRLESERRESARQALMVQEAERRRIARELHDEVGQTLTGRHAADRRPRRTHPRRAARPVGRAARDRATRDRGGAQDRAPASPGRVGGAGTAERSGRFGQRVRAAGAYPRLRRLEPAAAVTPEEELVIYRVAQEALTNVARHAEATWVQLELRDAADRIVLTVSDDGRGLPEGAAASSHGIRGMRERAMLIGATLHDREPARRGARRSSCRFLASTR